MKAGAVGLGAGVDAVEEEGDLIRPLPIDRQTVALRTTGEFGHARREFRKFKIVAAVERQFARLLAADHLAHFGGALVQHRRRGHDFKLRRGFADRQLHVLPHRLRDLHFEIGRFEAAGNPAFGPERCRLPAERTGMHNFRSDPS